MTSVQEKIKADTQLERRQAIAKSIAKILTLKGAKRWRASIALYLNINPYSEESGMTAREEYGAAVLDAEDIRAGNLNDFGSNKDKSIRQGLHAPSWFMTQIEMFDKTAFDATDKVKCKRNTQALFREFRELNTMEKL